MSLLRAEYRKITRRKIFPVMALVLLSFTGLGAFFFIVVADIAPELMGGMTMLTKPEVYMFGAQQSATQSWFPLILAVVLLGAELSTTVWGTGLTRDSRRIRQLMARFATYSVATFVAFLAATALWAIVAMIFAEGEGFLSTSDVVGVVWKSAVVAVAWTALGTGAVALLRSVGPAIGAGLAIYFAESFLAFWGPWQNVSITAATTALFNVDLAGAFGSLVPGGGLETWHQLAILAGWTLLGLGLTWWALQVRDA